MGKQLKKGDIVCKSELREEGAAHPFLVVIDKVELSVPKLLDYCDEKGLDYGKTKKRRK